MISGDGPAAVVQSRTPMQRVTWAWIGAGLDEAFAFCQEIGLGLQVERSRRFREHRACVAELTGALQAGGQAAARDLFDRNRVRAFTAVTEGAELVESLPFIRTVPRYLIRRKLARVLQGPPLPTDESANTNEGRNVLFELTMASKLWGAGLAPELGEPDIRCWLDRRAVYVECKRPFSRQGARQAYTDALGQLAAALPSAPVGARGIIALSITRFVNPGDRVFVHEREAVGKTHLSDEMTRVAQWLMRPTLWPAPPEGTIGLLWHVITPGFDRSQNLLVVAQQLNVEPTTPPGSADERLLQTLFDKLRLTWDSKGQP
jgi:hypothetical protein